LNVEYFPQSNNRFNNLDNYLTMPILMPIHDLGFFGREVS